MVDYKQLLIKYIASIEEIEGTTFLPLENHPSFTLEEVKELEKLEEEAMEYLEDKYPKKYLISQLKSLGVKLIYGSGDKPISISFGFCEDIKFCRELIKENEQIIDKITREEWNLK